MGFYVNGLEGTSPALERTKRHMKLKHWVVLAFAIIGVLAVFHYFQHQGGMNLGGSAGLNGMRVRAGAGVGGGGG